MPSDKDTLPVPVEMLRDAADYLAHYVGYIYEVKPDDLERHPYLPAVEDVVEGLRSIAALSAPMEPAGAQQVAAVPDLGEIERLLDVYIRRLQTPGYSVMEEQARTELLTGIRKLAASPSAPQPAQVAPAAQQVPVSDGVWEALQRLIENAATLGPASREDALLVAKWRGRFLPSSPQPQPAARMPLTERIAELVEQHGSLRAAARVLDVDPGYLSRLSSGAKDEPSDTLLRRMGLRRVVSYERRQKCAEHGIGIPLADGGTEG